MACMSLPYTLLHLDMRYRSHRNAWDRMQYLHSLLHIAVLHLGMYMSLNHMSVLVHKVDHIFHSAMYWIECPHIHCRITPYYRLQDNFSHTFQTYTFHHVHSVYCMLHSDVDHVVGRHTECLQRPNTVWSLRHRRQSNICLIHTSHSCGIPYCMHHSVQSPLVYVYTHFHNEPDSMDM